MRAAMQYLRSEDRHQHHERPAHQAQECKQRQNGPQRSESRNIGPAFAKLLDHRCGVTLLRGFVQMHHQQRHNDGNIADAIDKKAPALIGCGNQQSSQRRADEARHVHHGRVNGDGIGKIVAALHHLHHERLASRHVEGIDDALQCAQRQHFGDGDAMRERERTPARETAPSPEPASIPVLCAGRCDPRSRRRTARAERSESVRRSRQFPAAAPIRLAGRRAMKSPRGSSTCRSAKCSARRKRAGNCDDAARAMRANNRGTRRAPELIGAGSREF